MLNSHFMSRGIHAATSRVATRPKFRPVSCSLTMAYLSISIAHELSTLDNSLRTKKFIVHAPDLGLYYKTFYGINLQIFVISYSVCPRQAFPA